VLVPRNISIFIAPFLSVVNCGEFITDSSIFPLQLSEAESEVKILLDLDPGVLIPASDASLLKELHLSLIL